MGSNFAERLRFNTVEEILAPVDGRKPLFSHILDNEDGTYSVMSHINCEHCDYCDAENEYYEQIKATGKTWEEAWDICEINPIIHIAKEDPYENQMRYE